MSSSWTKLPWSETVYLWTPDTSNNHRETVLLIGRLNGLLSHYLSLLLQSDIEYVFTGFANSTYSNYEFNIHSCNHLHFDLLSEEPKMDLTGDPDSLAAQLNQVIYMWISSLVQYPPKPQILHMLMLHFRWREPVFSDVRLQGMLNGCVLLCTHQWLTPQCLSSSSDK